MAETTLTSDYRHIVLAKFKEDFTTQQLQELVTSLEQTFSDHDFIKSFEWGTDLGEVETRKGFTHIFMITFYGAEGFETFASLSAHKDNAPKFMASIEDILIFDYKPSYDKSNI